MKLSSDKIIYLLLVSLVLAFFVSWTYALIATNGAGNICINCQGEGWIEAGLFGIIGAAGFMKLMRGYVRETEDEIT